MACFGSFHFLQAMASHNVLINCYERVQVSLQGGAAFLKYKEGQVVLQNRADTTKWEDFYYKMGQLLLRSGTIIAK